MARLCVLLYDRIQGHPVQEEQLLALAAAFLIMAEHSGIPAQEAFTAVKNMMHDPMKASGMFEQFAGLREYLKAEGFH